MTTKAMIIVFAMPDCPACQDYKPRFERLVKGFQDHGCPLVWWRQNQMVLPSQIPIVMIDAGSVDPSIVQLADQYGISGVPATVLCTYNSRPQKLEGALEDHEIYEVLSSAVMANR